jgi:hypothetical protein
VRKLMICPWFGDEPEWASLYHRNADTLAEHGYDFLHDRDLETFRARVEDILGVACPIEPGTAKIHDYRPAFGQLYADELAGYDFWGHTDYDCVYGRVDRFVTDALLEDCDIFADCAYSYLAGPWTLYRAADPTVTALYEQVDGWRQILEDERVHAWVETSFTEAAKRYAVVTIDQFHRFTEPEALTTDGDGLFWHGEEISYFHFNRSKQWPTVRMVAA